MPAPATAPKLLHCYRCSRRLPAEDFPLDRSRATGRCSKCLVCARECAREWAMANPAARRAIDRRKDPAKVRARELARAALGGKKGTRCPRCREEVPRHRLHLHHPRGYANPKDVEILCARCHRACHAGRAA